MSQINSICILGGGTSGFSMSALLSQYRELSGLDFDIKLVYSEDIDTIGVGESTLLGINELFEYLGLKDDEWMKECNATYKVGIKFENFYKEGRYFNYPFGGRDRNREDAIRDWVMAMNAYPEICTPERASQYFSGKSNLLMEFNKLTDLTGTGIAEDEYDLSENSAYHFDSKLLGKYLRKYAEEKGVEIINDTFKKAELNDDDSIKSIVCNDGTYEADLFIDCSGFKSLLLGGVMSDDEEDYISYGDTLINDRVLRVNVPFESGVGNVASEIDENANFKEEHLKNYTNCVALKNGWVWEIPLWDRLSVGYVHSNKFATEQEIREEFAEYCKKYWMDVEEGDFQPVIEFKTGRYKKGWVKNVIGVGLSYGFIEPLESTGIATTLINSMRVLECLSKRDMYYRKVDADYYNESVADNLDGLRTFIEMHYFLSSRDDSEYWRYVVDEVDYYDNDKVGSSGGMTYSQFFEKIYLQRNYVTSAADLGLTLVACGMNYSCYSKALLLNSDYEKGRLLMGVNEFRDMYENEYPPEDLKLLPSTYEYTLENIYADT